MEILFAFAVAAFLILSGPIALIWCFVLSSRLNEMKGERDHLAFLLQKQQEKDVPTPSVSAPSIPPSPVLPDIDVPARPSSPKPPATSREVLQAIEIARRQAAEQLKSMESRKEPEAKTPELVAIPSVPPELPAAAEFEPRVTPLALTSTPLEPVLFSPEPITPIPLATDPMPTPPSTLEHDTPEPVSPVALPVEEPSPPQVLPDERESVVSGSRRPLSDAEWEESHPAPTARHGDFAWQSLELWIGRKLLGWVAVAAFIVAAALFIIHAVNEGWIGRIPPLFRVLGIAAFGGAFLAAGKHFHRIGWRRFSTMLSSAGVIIVFQAGYASFGYFELISIQTAGVVMPLVVLGSFLLSWHYGSVLLAVISIAGGLAVPILLSTDSDRYPEFFTYLVILNLGTVMLLNLLRRPPIGLLAFAGTQAEFWLWYTQYYIEPVAFEKLTAVLLFQGAFYAVYLLDTTVAAMVPKTLLNFGASLKNWLAADPHEKGDVTAAPPKPKIAMPTWDDVVRAVLSPLVLFGTAWWLLRNEPTLGPWLGLAAFIGAAWYALLAVVYTRHLARIGSPEIDSHFSAYWKAAPAAATVISLAFLAVGIPLHFQAEWLALGWGTVFAGLWYFGHRQRNRTFLVMAVVFMVLGATRFLYDIFSQGFNPAVLGDKLATLTKAPELGLYDLPSLAAILIVLTATVLLDRLLKSQGREEERERNFWLGLTGYGFLALLCTVEALRYFLFRPGFYVPAPHWASFSLTVLWSVLALALLETGVIFRSPMLRAAALTAFGVVVVKMGLFDFYSRLQFQTPIHNPFCPGLIGCSVLLMAVAVQARYSSRFDEAEKIRGGVLGLAGLIILPAVLSIECYQYYFLNTPPFPLPLDVPPEGLGAGEKRLLALGTLSVLWSLYAALVLVTGLTFRARTLRACGLVMLVGTVTKIVCLEIVHRLDYTTAFWNSYFLTMLWPGLILMVFAVWTTRVKPLDDEPERDAFRYSGVLGLSLFLVITSVECFFHFKLHPLALEPLNERTAVFFAVASLSVLWAVFGTALMVLGLGFRSLTVRVCAAMVLMAALVKFAVLEMFFRPDYQAALFNPHALTVLCPILAVLGFAVWTTRIKPLADEPERFVLLILGLFGLLLLWIVLSVECFAYFFRNPFLYAAEDDFQRRLVATSSLAVLWTLLAGILMGLGLSARSLVLRVCAFVVFVAALGTLKGGLYDYGVFLVNPYFLTAIWPLMAVMFFAVWVTRIKPLENVPERLCFLWLGLVGILLFWGVLSRELYSHFLRAPLLLSSAVTETMTRFTATASLSILWSTVAALLVVLGIGFRSMYLRCFGLLVFGAVTLKIAFLEMFRRPEFETALLNPYFIPIGVAALVMICCAVWTTRLKPLKNDLERIGYFSFGVIGVLLLWGAASFECYGYFDIRTDWSDHRFLALASLTVFWTVLGIFVAGIAVATGSRPLRILAVLLIVLAFFKVLPYELWERPGYLTPFLNPYAGPLVLLAFAMIFVCVVLIAKIGEPDEVDLKVEKTIYRSLAFIGVVLLWTIMSLECFKAVRILQDAADEAWKAQMALSILWSVFAGALIFVGFVWRSAVLRWMAILLFAVTLTKVMIVDMAGVHQMYRFGAVFVFAVVLSLAAWAYQRFRPESRRRDGRYGASDKK